MKRIVVASMFLGCVAAQDAATKQSQGQQVLQWCAELGDAKRCESAAHALWRAGSSVAPVLLREVQKSSAGSPMALRLLAAFGRDAASVSEPLERIYSTGAHRENVAIGLTLAAIGSRDSVTVASFSGYIVELDPDGKELRRVTQGGVWGLAPLPGDRLLVTEIATHTVREIDWQGVVHWTATVPQSPLDALRLSDGTTVVACWHGPCVVWLDAAGKETRRVDGLHAVDIEPLWSGNLLICDHEGNRLVELDPTGDIVWQFRCPGKPMDADILPNGNLLVSINGPNRIVEYERAGDTLRVVHTKQSTVQPEDVYRLRDGRMFLTHSSGASLYDSDGKQIWRAATSHSSQAIVRLPSAH